MELINQLTKHLKENVSGECDHLLRYNLLDRVVKYTPTKNFPLAVRRSVEVLRQALPLNPHLDVGVKVLGKPLIRYGIATDLTKTPTLFIKFIDTKTFNQYEGKTIKGFFKWTDKSKSGDVYIYKGHVSTSKRDIFPVDLHIKRDLETKETKAIKAINIEISEKIYKEDVPTKTFEREFLHKIDCYVRITPTLMYSTVLYLAKEVDMLALRNTWLIRFMVKGISRPTEPRSRRWRFDVNDYIVEGEVITHEGLYKAYFIFDKRAMKSEQEFDRAIKQGFRVYEMIHIKVNDSILQRAVKLFNNFVKLKERILLLNHYRRETTLSGDEGKYKLGFKSSRMANEIPLAVLVRYIAKDGSYEQFHVLKERGEFYLERIKNEFNRLRLYGHEKEGIGIQFLFTNKYSINQYPTNHFLLLSLDDVARRYPGRYKSKEWQRKIKKKEGFGDDYWRFSYSFSVKRRLTRKEREKEEKAKKEPAWFEKVPFYIPRAIEYKPI